MVAVQSADSDTLLHVSLYALQHDVMYSTVLSYAHYAQLIRSFARQQGLLAQKA